MRGSNIGDKLINDRLALVAEGAKLTRWTLVYVDFEKVTNDAEYAKYRMVIDQQLDEIIADKVLLGRIICLYHPPGPIKYSSDRWRLWYYETWKAIANKLKGQDRIYGYDLTNEPNAKSSDLSRLYKKVAEKIRIIDPSVNIIGSCKWGLPAYLKDMSPVAGVDMMTVHQWLPLSFTHQGVYPQFIYPRAYDSGVTSVIQRDLNRMKAWRDKYKKPILVGEFGCARWAPNCQAYLKLIVDFCNTHQFDHVHHAWRGYTGWDLTLSANINDMSGNPDLPNERWKIISDDWSLP